MKRTERLFAIAEALRARRTGVTAETLAERFGVSLRTIYRDLDALRDADLPLVAERGRGGGFALDRAYSLPPVNFTAREAAALAIVVRQAIDLRTLPFDETLERAGDKVRAALPVASQRELGSLLGRLRFIGVPARTAPPTVRRAIETALFEGRVLALTYLGANLALSKRRVRVRMLLFDRAETLVNTTDADTGDERQLRLDRIQEASVESL